MTTTTTADLALMREAAAYLLNLVEAEGLPLPFTMTVRPGVAYSTNLRSYSLCARGFVSAHWSPTTGPAVLDALADRIGVPYERRGDDRFSSRAVLVDLGGELPVVVELVCTLPERGDQ